MVMFMSLVNRKVNPVLYQSSFVTKWEEILAHYNNKFSKFPHWVFRGQRKPKEFELATSLERAFREFESDKPDTKGKKYPREELEQRLIREFRRKAAIYVQALPDENDTLEWLSMMRHYEGPTRLLDCMYSYFIAVYFALRESTDDFKIYEAEIWAFNAAWFWNNTITIIQKKAPELLDKIHDPQSRTARNLIFDSLMKNPFPLVLNMTPIGLNQRITIQQGTFLVPGDINRTFVENLNEYAHLLNKGPKPIFRINIKLDKKRRNEVLRHLNAMNINESTLFPDLGGFAKSLRIRLAFPEIFGVSKE